MKSIICLIIACLIVAVIWACVAISAPAATSVMLQWELSNGEPLGPGGGYHVYQSKSPGVYGSPVATIAAGISTVTLQVDSGTKYFVVTAFTADGTESNFSNEAFITVKPGAPTNLRIK